MPPRPGVPSVFSSSLRYLQTSAPLPPPNSSLPPPSPSTGVAAGASSSSNTASSSSSRLGPLLPPSAPSVSTTSSALSLIASQSTASAGRYLLARLHSRTYLLHPRDILTVPALKPSPAPGTILGLTRILEVGSRDYAIRSPAAQGKALSRELRIQKGERVDETIPAGLVRCGLTVLEHTKSPLERIIKKKRRKGYKKTIEHKQGWTRLRVGDIELGEGLSAAASASASVSALASPATAA